MAEIALSSRRMQSRKPRPIRSPRSVAISVDKPKSRKALRSGQLFGTALFKRLGQVGHQPNAKAGAIGDDLDDVAAVAFPFPPMVMHVQRNAESVLTDKPEAGPKIGMGLCRLRDLADAGIQHGGDASRLAIAAQQSRYLRTNA